MFLYLFFQSVDHSIGLGFLYCIFKCILCLFVSLFSSFSPIPPCSSALSYSLSFKLFQIFLLFLLFTHFFSPPCSPFYHLSLLLINFFSCLPSYQFLLFFLLSCHFFFHYNLVNTIMLFFSSHKRLKEKSEGLKKALLVLKYLFLAVSMISVWQSDVQCQFCFHIIITVFSKPPLVPRIRHGCKCCNLCYFRHDLTQKRVYEA